MQFVSLKEQPILDYIDFYRNKFPIAFKKAPEEPKEDETPADWPWQTPALEKQFAQFDEDMGKAQKQKSALALIQTLISNKDLVMNLPVSNKKIECTLPRFFLYLLPCVQLAEKQDGKKTKEIMSQFIELLSNASSVSLHTKVTAFLQMYNATQDGLRAMVFQAFVKILQKENQLDIMVQRARSIEQEQASWNLTADERKELFLTVAQALDASNDEGAFQVMHAYLRQFELDKNTANMAPIEPHARRCVILAIKTIRVINFEELLDLKAIKALESKHQDVFKFLNLFTKTDAKNFLKELTQFDKLMAAEGLNKDDMILKKTYVQICSLNTDKTNFKYAELATLLNISADDVEEWAIDAISNEIIDAKIDQQNQEIVIKSHQLREIKKAEWQQIQNKVRQWRERFELMHHVLAAAPATPAPKQATN